MAGTFVKCIYKFDGEVDGDLSLNVGDVVQVTNIVSEDWYEGVLNGNTGQFPKAFVEETTSTDKKIDDVFDMGIAVSSFTAEQDDDLTLNEGEVVVITKVIDENWAIGYTHGGHKGTFPRAFVKQISFEDSSMKDALQAAVPSFDKRDGILEKDIIEETEEVSSKNDSVDSYFVVAPFSAQSDTELELKEGDFVEVISIYDDFWLEGKLDNGKTGIFPRSCIDFPEEKVKDINTLEATEDKTHQVEQEKIADIYVVAIFDYNSSVDGDLNFKIGDSIKLIKEIDDNWYCGELSGIQGVFPVNHVERVNNNKELSQLDPAETKISETDAVSMDRSFSPPPSEEVQSNLEKKQDEQQKEPVTDKDSPVVQKPVKKPPPSRPATGPKKPAKPKPPIPSSKSSTPTPEVTEKPKKKPPPERPKMPVVKKDTTPPFTFKFDTESRPLVIISGRYVKEGEPNVIILRRTLKT